MSLHALPTTTPVVTGELGAAYRSGMDGPLCSEEYEALHLLGELLRDPEKYGVRIDRGTDPKAATILDDGLEVLRTVWGRRPSRVGVV